MLIVAHYDETTITLNAEENIVATINKGDYYIIEGDKFSDGNLYVSTSEKVFAYQGVGGASEANQGMFFVPPLSCESRGDVNNIASFSSIPKKPHLNPNPILLCLIIYQFLFK